MEQIIISFLCGLSAGLVDIYLLNRFFRSIVENIGGEPGGIVGKVFILPFAIFRWVAVGLILAVSILLFKVHIVPMLIGVTVPIFITFFWRIYKFFKE